MDDQSQVVIAKHLSDDIILMYLREAVLKDPQDRLEGLERIIAGEAWVRGLLILKEDGKDMW